MKKVNYFFHKCNQQRITSVKEVKVFRIQILLEIY